MRAPVDLSSSPFLIASDGLGIHGVTPIVGTDGDDFLDGTSVADKIKGLGGDDILFGEDGDDTLLGGGGNDTLYGQGGDDRLTGGGGDDYMRGYAGDDTLNGGAGYDIGSIYAVGGGPLNIDLSAFHAGKTISFADGLGGTDTFISVEQINVTATVNADTIVGSAGRDGITTAGGADLVDSGGGDDAIGDYAGDATIHAGTGDDTIYIAGWTYPSGKFFAGGHDVVDGGAGTDSVEINWEQTSSALTVAWTKDGVTASLADGSASVAMTGVEGLKVTAGTGGATMQGGGAADVLHGGSDGVDVIDGAGGDDTIGGGGLADSLTGGDGDDSIFGGLGDDTLSGGQGMDRYGVAGGVTSGETGPLVIDMSGFDIHGGSHVIDDMQGGHDTISGFEAVAIHTSPSQDHAIGSAGDDLIYDSLGFDLLEGGAGDDVIYQASDYLGGGSDFDLRDTMDGGKGIDTLSFETAFASEGAQGWLFDLKAGTVTGALTDVDTISGFEHVIGSKAFDTILGAAGGETLEGGLGDDVIQGRGGADVLSGGEDADTFVYAALSDSGAGGRDLITDLAKEDVIDLSLLDADTTTAGDQAFHLVASFGHHAGELTLTYDHVARTTLLAADVDGDGVADFSVTLAGDQHRFEGFVL